MGAYNDDVLYIHIPKTAGITCKEYMHEHLPDVKWPRTDEWFKNKGHPEKEAEELAKQSVEESKLPIGHIPLRDLPGLTGRPLNSWERIIGVVRNPYAQQVSQWNFWRDRYARGQIHMHDMAAASHPRIHTWLDQSGTPGVDFHIWYAHRFHAGEPWVEQPRGDGRYDHWGGYYRFWLFDENNRKPDNLTILKTEELDQTFPAALAPWIAGTPPELGRLNTRPHSKWEEYYSAADKARIEKSLAIVEEKFAWTFAEGLYTKMAVGDT